MNSVIRIAACAAALACALPATAATQTLEVNSGPLGSRGTLIANSGPIGQSFTAFTDTLTSAGFQFATFNAQFANSPITLSLFAGETLTGSALFTTTFTLPTGLARNATWFDIALPDLAVTNGSLYSFVLSTTSFRTAIYLGPDIVYGTPGFPNGQIVGGDAYTGGKLLAARSTYPNCAEAAGNNCDLNFRITGDLIAAAVPEPASWAMLILGFGVVGGALRRTRKPRIALTFA